MRYIVGVDLAYAKDIIIATMALRRPKSVKTYRISPKRKFEALRAIYQLLRRLSPAIVVVEAPIIQVNRSVAFKMTRWVGILEAISFMADCKFIGIHPSTWQKRVLPKFERGDSKIASLKEAERFLGRKATSDDEADAVNIVRYAYGNLQNVLRAIHETDDS